MKHVFFGPFKMAYVLDVQTKWPPDKMPTFMQPRKKCLLDKMPLRQNATNQDIY